MNRRPVAVTSLLSLAAVCLIPASALASGMADETHAASCSSPVAEYHPRTETVDRQGSSNAVFLDNRRGTSRTSATLEVPDESTLEELPTFEPTDNLYTLVEQMRPFLFGSTGEAYWERYPTSVDLIAPANTIVYAQLISSTHSFEGDAHESAAACVGTSDGGTNQDVVESMGWSTW
ncbi:hypothetical protein [Glutamicibacter sp. PS]|uniref:hypothetical protein n=1 Tax=Glutamicibacter sp. PS TaxID=3075634 RepID=UPI00284A0DB9|nr:hypothetical protein [Glutamicibacter sp. PS]MDR4533560.1 hypothetical protein [Glutamicibacter sp. PS]